MSDLLDGWADEVLTHWQNSSHSLSDEGYQAMLDELDTEVGMMALEAEEKVATGVVGTLEVVCDEDTAWLNK